MVPAKFNSFRKGAEATWFIRMPGWASAYFTNAVTEVDLNNAATLHHYRINSDNENSTHLGSVHIKIGKDANYEGFGRILQVGSNGDICPLEQGGCALNGAYLLKGREHCDNTPVIEHVVLNTNCSEILVFLMTRLGVYFRSHVVIKTLNARTAINSRMLCCFPIRQRWTLNRN